MTKYSRLLTLRHTRKLVAPLPVAQSGVAELVHPRRRRRRCSPREIPRPAAFAADWSEGGKGRWPKAISLTIDSGVLMVNYVVFRAILRYGSAVLFCNIACTTHHNHKALLDYSPRLRPRVEKPVRSCATPKPMCAVSGCDIAQRLWNYDASWLYGASLSALDFKLAPQSG